MNFTVTSSCEFIALENLAVFCRYPADVERGWLLVHEAQEEVTPTNIIITQMSSCSKIWRQRPGGSRD
jgi:hypothetical protein